MQHSRQRSLLPRITLTVLIGLIVGCHNPTDPGSLACQQTYEFGNTGCFEVAGQVIGSRGQALAGIWVGPRPVLGPSRFNSAYRMTDSAGSFRLRLSRMIGRPPASAVPDTLSVYVIATDPRSTGIGSPATARDSVLTIVTVAPVGTIPQAAQVRITLQVP